MRTRIITAVVAICIFAPVLYYSNTIAFPITIALLSLIAVFEMLRCIGIKNPAIYVPACLMATAFPICARFTVKTMLFVSCLCAIYFCFLLYVFALSVFSHGKFDVETAFAVIATVLYIVASFTSIVLLRDSLYRARLFLLAFIGPWVSDSAAYFCGRAFGKHKLIPDVSPKKTIEGSIGGILFTGIIFIVYAFIVMEKKPDVLTSVMLFAVGIIISIVSQIGDLIASLIKRKYGIKDYGKLFPGHGGVMDRFDSVLVTAPILFVAAQLAAYYAIFG